MPHPSNVQAEGALTAQREAALGHVLHHRVGLKCQAAQVVILVGDYTYADDYLPHYLPDGEARAPCWGCPHRPTQHAGACTWRLHAAFAEAPARASLTAQHAVCPHWEEMVVWGSPRVGALQPAASGPSIGLLLAV